VIDMRTKEEYESGHIIDAINFEILNHKERKEVSILYNKGLNQEAYLLAYEYALDKLPKLFRIIKKYKDKNIVFYCARGGSRSTIVYEVFKNLKAISIYKIKEGYKSYRQFTNTFFENSLISYDALTIYENIGVKLPRKSIDSNKYLLLDLRNKMKPEENPFILLKTKEEYFNNRMLNYFIFNKLYYSEHTRIVFILPVIKKLSDVLHEKISRLIEFGFKFYLSGTIKERVKTIRENYLEEDLTTRLLINFLNNKRKEISNALVDDIIRLLNEKNYDIAIEAILLNYTDPIMDHYMAKNEIKKIVSIKKVNEYLESWSE
jgi:tRNA 2-selenouridine synthase